MLYPRSREREGLARACVRADYSCLTSAALAIGVTGGLKWRTEASGDMRGLKATPAANVYITEVSNWPSGVGLSADAAGAWSPRQSGFSPV